MKPTRLLTKDRKYESATDHPYRRRGFLAVGASAGATLLAGCSGETGLGGPDGDGTTRNPTDGGDSASGTFRLLISDRPVAIDDFDELNVSFDRARIFRGEGDDDDEEGESDAPSPTTTETEMATETATPDGTATATATETVTATSTVTATEAASETEAEDDEPDDGDQRGFFTIDLDGATVDLTKVVGEKAIGVFDGELPEGRYAKIELYAASVEGIVDGDPVNVTIPSGKLQIVKPFEVRADETLTFVFDINVVKKGKTGEYNLLPVISESGVAGRDVEVEEVENGNDNSDEEETEEEETEESEGQKGSDNGESGGPPDGSGGDS